MKSIFRTCTAVGLLFILSLGYSQKPYVDKSTGELLDSLCTQFNINRVKVYYVTNSFKDERIEYNCVKSENIYNYGFQGNFLVEDPESISANYLSLNRIWRFEFDETKRYRTLQVYIAID